ncbi:eukaryotic translation initiation factor 5B-like [Mizuhopecten yessoensis]|uniref:Eukaryotic translation initiation factor 5B n=1 Tax=Mizuhopecten yessoensis TaxID=6573 RepID=A0A210Q4V7_MIZYE|nr:eukaryotic translation initiation factor 5B-like [Mizuhopecten yessoensis]OWF43780.1 Eukaryotic translation initiation factor 5B [Mizuhopecten yessoensis]
MGKPKNKGKKGQDEEFDDDIPDPVLESGAADEEIVKPSTKSAGKKKNRRKKDDDWEDDVAAELAALSMENKGDDVNGEEEEEDVYVPKKKEKKKKKKTKADDEDDMLEDDNIEDEEVVQNSKSKKKSNMATFQLLMEDEDDMGSDKNVDDDDDDDEDKEDIIESKPKEVVVESNKSKSKSKKDKKKGQKDEDIDAILADLEKPKTSKKKKKKGGNVEEEEEGERAANNDVPTEEDLEAKMQPKVVTMEDLEEEDDDDRKKRKKKGKKKDTKEEAEGEEEMEEGDEGEEAEEGSTVKTNAQKRKEKREREKLKKQQEKKKQKPKPTEEADATPAESTEGATVEEGAEGENKDGEDEKKEEKEGKKKKKKGEKEEKKKKTKAPVAAIKAQLELIRAEEERIRKEEEEREKREEEERVRKEEEKRLEEEKKQRKKQKEKEKKERLKQEGKLLTGKQKQDRQRAMQMLEEMKARGIDIPNRDEIVKKRPIYSNRKKNQKQQQHTEDTPSPVEEVSPSVSIEEKTPEPETKKEEKETEEVADAWDAEDDTKDAWDAEDEEKKEEEKEVEKTTEPVIEEKEEEIEEESDEESEEEDDEEEEEEESSTEEESEDDDLTPVERARDRIMKRREEAEKQRSTDVLRSTVVCVLGHVDTGKTKILDKLRKTNVQDGEAGGITQQIGATNVPEHAIRDQTKMCKEFSKKELKVPGLLIIDTPGHESFSNLRSRGSSLCDIAILVVDIMHGLEPQTIESINLLKLRKTPFIIALNKVDRLYQWKPMPQTDIVNVIKKQNPQTKGEFDKRSREVITQMAEQGLNSALFFENKNPKEYISLVPTSAHSGDGMGNLIALLCELSQTMLAKRLSYCTELQATVMEVKALHGLGTTIDVILVNGKLREGDLMVVPGTEGPIVTQIRGLLMPQPMRELRVKSQWEHHKEVLAAQGVKIIAKDMEKAVAGLPLYVAKNQDETEYYKEELSAALKEALNSIKLSERGVFVQASTLGSLEALLEFLKVSNIPYAGINIGPVHRKDIMKASIMLEHDTQYATILAFDVRVEREAQEMADNLGVTIFTADIIYNLFDKFIAYRNAIKKKNQDLYRHIAVFPCKVRILPQFIFNSRDPIVCGVIIEDGFLKEGTPLCVPSKEFLDIGRVTSVEANHKHVDIARKGMEVCIKVEPLPGDTPKMFGRHFDETDMLTSKISRNSIDAVKNYFREDMLKQDWQLMLELKKKFEIL